LKKKKILYKFSKKMKMREFESLKVR
jgi:hypothetical protein